MGGSRILTWGAAGGQRAGHGRQHVAAWRVDDPVEFRNSTSLNHTQSSELSIRAQFRDMSVDERTAIGKHEKNVPAHFISASNLGGNEMTQKAVRKVLQSASMHHLPCHATRQGIHLHAEGRQAYDLRSWLTAIVEDQSTQTRWWLVYLHLQTIAVRKLS